MRVLWYYLFRYEALTVGKEKILLGSVFTIMESQNYFLWCGCIEIRRYGQNSL